MSYSKRVEQIAGHLNYPKGMLAGQVAIITGSGQGIGAETARLFANEGAKLVVSDIDAGMTLRLAMNCANRMLRSPVSQVRSRGKADQRKWRKRHCCAW